MSVYSVVAGNRAIFCGTSADTKPTTAVAPGSLFVETDTLKQFIFSSANSWQPYVDVAVSYLWQPSSLSYIPANADSSGNLNVTSAGGGTGNVNIAQYGGTSVGPTNAFYVQPGTGATFSTKTALTPSSPTFATVGVSSAQAVAANTNRKGLILTNNSTANISLGFGVVAVSGSGVVLYPGGVFFMDEFMYTTAAVNAIATAASANLGVQEWA